MHTWETLCSHIATNPGSAESTRLVYLAHHHFILNIYICYIGSSVVVLLNLLRLVKGLWFVAAQSLKYVLMGLLWCNITGVTGYHIG